MCDILVLKEINQAQVVIPCRVLWLHHDKDIICVSHKHDTSSFPSMATTGFKVLVETMGAQDWPNTGMWIVLALTGQKAEKMSVGIVNWKVGIHKFHCGYSLHVF